MKRKILAFSLMLILFCSGAVFGSSYSKKITAYFYDIKVSLDGKDVAFSSEPFIYDETTYVSLRDVGEALGINVYWDNNNKTIYMHSGGESYNNTYDIALLQNQLKAKDEEIKKLKDDDDDEDDDEDLNDVEDTLEDDYDRYTKGDEDLRFTFSLSQRSNDDILIKMYGDFDRTDDAWDDRDDSEFREFIEDICDEVRKDFKEDMEIIVYDEDKDKAAEYTYDYSDKDLDIEKEY